MEALRALIHCHRYQHKQFQEAGILSYSDFSEMLDRQAARFMCAQKGDYGLERVSCQIDAEMQAVKGRADTWIVSADVSDYVRFVQEAKIYHYKGGQEAVDRVNGRSNVKRTASGDTQGVTQTIEPYNMIGNARVYLARSYSIDGSTQLDLLSRIVEVGIYNTMFDRTRDYRKYQSAGRNIRVFNNDRDDWAEIKLADAIRNASIWDSKGELDKTPLVRAGSNGNSLHSDDYDFLSYRLNATTRENIRCFGDMSPNFVHASHFLNAARTIHNFLRDNKSDDEIGAGWTGAGTRRAGVPDPLDGGADAPVQSSLADYAQSASMVRLATQLRQVLGTKNTVVPGMSNEGIAALMTSSTHDLVAPASQVGASSGNAVAPEDEARKYLIDIVGYAVPDTHKPQLEQIASNASAPWTERSAKIKELILKCQSEDAASVPAVLKRPADVDKWYAQRFKAFKDRVAEIAQRNAGASGKAELFLVPAGTRMPAGHTLVHSAINGTWAQRLQVIGLGVPGERGAKVVDERVYNENFFANIKAIDAGGASSTITTLAKLYAGAPFTRDQLLSYVQSNIAVLLGFVLFRVHCTYQTRYGIKCAAGGKTGYSMYGNTNMMLSSEAARKVGLFHYTAYMSSVVMYPKNVYILEDLFCKKYLGGMGIDFWSPTEYKNTGNRKTRSIICVPVPPTRESLDRKVDIRGRWYTALDMGLISEEKFERPLYEGATRTCLLYKLRDTGRKNQQSNRASTAVNFVAFQGIQFHFNTTTDTWCEMIEEAGHFGGRGNVYPTCGRVRNSESVLLGGNPHTAAVAF